MMDPVKRYGDIQSDSGVDEDSESSGWAEYKHRPAEVRPPSAYVGSWQDVIRAIPPAYHRTAISLRHLISKAIKTEVHVKQLQRYSEMRTIPRGLRIKNQPFTMLHCPEFLDAWASYAEAASLELMSALVEEHQRQLAVVQERIRRSYEELKSGLTKEEYALTKGVYESNAKTELKQIQDVVESKLRRDVDEYGRNCAAPRLPCGPGSGRSSPGSGGGGGGGRRSPQTRAGPSDQRSGHQARCGKRPQEMNRERRDPSINTLIKHKKETLEKENACTRDV